MTLTVGSLFSGIGGLDLGLERAGMRVAWQSEIDPYCCQVLAKHWPDVPNLGDVTTVDWSEVPCVDVICGGYPCQPFSAAGRRQGDKDPRHLWPHMLDAIRVLRPDYALLENVAGHLALGFGRVLGDLAEIGYDTEWDCIPAAAVGALHLRWRVFVIGTRRQPCLAGRTTNRVVADTLRGPDIESTSKSQEEGPRHPNLVRKRGAPLADADGTGLERPRLFWAAPQRGRDWTTEPDVGRVAHGIPHRVDRLRALGNAVVPQVAEHIGRLIIEVAA